MSTPRHNPRCCARAGSTLVELLVALPIALALAVSAAAMLVHVGRTLRLQSSTLGTARELRQSVRVLSADLEPLRGDALRMVSDTLLEFTSQLGVMTVCSAPSARTLIAAVPYATDDLWISGLKVGDDARTWRANMLGDDPTLTPRVLTAAPVPLGNGTCGADGAPHSGPRWRFTFADSSFGIAVGSPLSWHRAVRFRHYRSGSSWWLGRQAWDMAAWEIIQPVAGPFRAPVSGMVTMRTRDALDQPLPITLATPDSIRARAAWLVVSLGIARRTTQLGLDDGDSVHVRIPLRADAYRRQ